MTCGRELQRYPQNLKDWKKGVPLRFEIWVRKTAHPYNIIGSTTFSPRINSKWRGTPLYHPPIGTRLNLSLWFHNRVWPPPQKKRMQGGRFIFHYDFRMGCDPNLQQSGSKNTRWFISQYDFRMGCDPSSATEWLKNTRWFISHYDFKIGCDPPSATGWLKKYMMVHLVPPQQQQQQPRQSLYDLTALRPQVKRADKCHSCKCQQKSSVTTWDGSKNGWVKRPLWKSPSTLFFYPIPLFFPLPATQ